jgi:hypothetical protein
MSVRSSQVVEFVGTRRNRGRQIATRKLVVEEESVRGGPERGLSLEKEEAKRRINTKSEGDIVRDKRHPGPNVHHTP